MLYYKEINGRTVFSECKSILMPDGTWVSNPTEEQIAEAGFSVYVPPVIPPQPQTEPGYDQIVDAVKKMLSEGAEQLSDEDALDVAALFPTWVSKMGEEVTAGERLWYDGFLWKVLQPHTVQDNWTPSTSPSLYVKVSIEEIPDWVQPTGAQDAYNKGDKVKHNDKTWESLVDNNVWEPGATGTETLWKDV
ncbi:MAG: hypothetical protein IJ882_06690 [Paludibacteraceae bacterium]|nr:hypothetical protein [Paludibacteraceae bacterium]